MFLSKNSSKKLVTLDKRWAENNNNFQKVAKFSNLKFSRRLGPA